MTPYYEAGGVTIYCGDCREVLPMLARGSVDLIVTDPPYGVRYESHRRKASLGVIVGDCDTTIGDAALPLMFDALRNRRHIYLFGRWCLDGLPTGATAELIWDKDWPVAGNLTIPWGIQHEPIQFAAKIAMPSQRAEGGGNLSARLRRGSVLRYRRLHTPSHPTEKPVPLLRELIESSSRIGELVLDPFMGVGSTLVAAHLEGRQAIGIEIEERYCEIAARRLEQARQQPLPLEVGA